MSPYREQRTPSKYNLTATTKPAADETHEVSAVPRRLWRISARHPAVVSEQEDVAADTFPSLDDDGPEASATNEIVRLRALLLTCEEQRIAQLEEQVAALVSRAGKELKLPLLEAGTVPLVLPPADEDPEMTRLRLLVFATERQRIAHLETQVAALQTHIEQLDDTTLPPIATAAAQTQSTLPPFESAGGSAVSPEVAHLRTLLLKADQQRILALEAQVAVLHERFDALDARARDAAADTPPPEPAPEDEQYEVAEDAPPAARTPAPQPAPEREPDEVVEEPPCATAPAPPAPVPPPAPPVARTVHRAEPEPERHLLAHLLERQHILRYTVPAASRLAAHQGEIIACTLQQPDQPATHPTPEDTPLATSIPAPPAPAAHPEPDPPAPPDEPPPPHHETTPDTATAGVSEDGQVATPASPGEHTNGHHPAVSHELERLRALLIEPERQRLAYLETQLAILRQQVDDSDVDYTSLYGSAEYDGADDAYGNGSTAGSDDLATMLPHDHAAAGGDGYLSSFQSDIELLINLLEQTPGQAAQRTDESLPETAAALPMPDNAPVASQPTSQPAEAWQEAEDDGPLDMEKTLLSAMSADMPPPDIPSAPTATGTHQNAAAPERAPRPPRVPSPQPARQERLVMRVAWLESEITAMHRQLDNRDELIAMVAPVISLIIAERVRESRDEMAEALYPVIGKTIGKAVTEALRELARRVDTTVRSKTNVKQAFQWWRMRMQGVDPQASALRALLPFSVQEIFLIHTESGLLIHHISNTNTLTDADLISGMLTAIRSYVKDSFAYKDGSLDEITYGDFRILMEDGTLAILAIVIQGNEPANFREHMRTQLTELHLMCSSTLRDFTGDPVDEEKVMPFLKPLLESPDDTA